VSNGEEEEGKMPSTPDRASDHLANERTFLAWVRTGVAFVVFGFAIGRFGIALHQFMQVQGHGIKHSGLSIWLGLGCIFIGVILVGCGLKRYTTTRMQLETGVYEASYGVLALVAMLTALMGLAMGAYLVYAQIQL
jgi:putative membrane protein